MEAIGRTGEKSSAVEGDALKSGGGGADEFLNGEKNGPGAEAVEKKGGEWADVFIG